jgi:hypothetical protein
VELEFYENKSSNWLGDSYFSIFYFHVHSIYAESLSPLTKSPGTLSHSVNVNFISTTVIPAEDLITK